MDWRHAYQEHARATRDLLHQAQAAGVPIVRLASGAVDPRRLSFADIARVALRDAERIVTEAINREAEAERRKRRTA